MWDYHVIICHCAHAGKTTEPRSPLLVYDLDTTLNFPCDAQTYFQSTFKPELEIKPDYDRFFRVVPGGVALSRFSCDRSHMRTPDGGWNAPPPPYPCYDRNGENNLSRFTDMKDKDFVGKVLDLDNFGTFLSGDLRV